MQKHAASRFINDNFDPEDHLAIVLIDRRSGAVTQRLASARQIALSVDSGTIDLVGYVEGQGYRDRSLPPSRRVVARWLDDCSFPAPGLLNAGSCGTLTCIRLPIVPVPGRRDGTDRSCGAG